MRATDTENNYFGIDRRISATEKDISVLSANISDLRSSIKEEQAEVRDALKDLALSQTQQANALAKIEAGISTLAKALAISIPLISSIFAGFWAYNLNVIGALKDTQTQMIKGSYHHEQ